MKAIKIIAGVLILGVILLAFIANREYNRAEWWRSKPMRDARHKKKVGDTEEEEEEEEEPEEFPEPESTPVMKVEEQPKEVAQ